MILFTLYTKYMIRYDDKKILYKLSAHFYQKNDKKNTNQFITIHHEQNWRVRKRKNVLPFLYCLISFSQIQFLYRK